MPLRTKLILWHSVLLAFVMFIFGASVFTVMRWALMNPVDTKLDETAKLVLDNSSATMLGEFGSPGTLVVRLPPLDVFWSSDVYVQAWVLQDGQLTLRDSSSNLPNFPNALDPVALGSQDARYNNVIVTSNVEFRVLTRPIFSGGQFLGDLQVAAPIETINRAIDRLLLITIVSVLFGLIGSIALGLWLTHRALKPIDTITRAAARIAATDDLSTRLPYSGPMDEMGRLAKVFNHMMERLEHLFGVQSRFVADVSHELRTPLTAIRGNLDLIKRYGMDKESFEAIESEVERMSRMVSDLLLLARADYGGMKLELAPLDLDTVVSEVYREGRVLTKDRDLKLNIEDFVPVRINGNADRLKQLLLNLVSNAIKFTPDGGRIIIHLRRVEDNAVVEIQDTGVGIAPEHLEHIFDRFYQVEASRARSQNEGAGLGLSIARWIAEAHGGKISVSSEPGKGSLFTVTLPVLKEPGRISSQEITRPRISLIPRG
jgi:two-component system, OmpR family, sensor kinase